ncbi:MAG: biopolymer transporter ExbD [Pirellulales bacterium]|nr:biopolymer transporter ExbD [Pirellulales bacterium]
MKIRHTTAGLPDKIEFNMTPMIDCVFQLLSFFIMSLKFVVPEGDFDIKMPSAAPSAQNIDINLIPPIPVKLVSNADGSLKGIYVNNKFKSSFADLRKEIISIVGTNEQGPAAAKNGAEAEIDCDYNLKYEYLIAAVTHVSGYIDNKGVVVKLIEKLKFKPPKSAPR